MITRESIEKIINDRVENYSDFLASTIEKIDRRFKVRATLYGKRNIEYIVRNPGTSAGRLRRDLANYYTALGFFGGLGVNSDGDIVINLSIDAPIAQTPQIPTDIPPTPNDADAPAEIPEENQ